jgi:hypothetical protein
MIFALLRLWKLFADDFRAVAIFTTCWTATRMALCTFGAGCSIATLNRPRMASCTIATCWTALSHPPMALCTIATLEVARGRLLLIFRLSFDISTSEVALGRLVALSPHVGLL